jgi:hypothetical protein
MDALLLLALFGNIRIEFKKVKNSICTVQYIFFLSPTEGGTKESATVSEIEIEIYSNLH